MKGKKGPEEAYKGWSKGKNKSKDKRQAHVAQQAAPSQPASSSAQPPQPAENQRSYPSQKRIPGVTNGVIRRLKPVTMMSTGMAGIEKKPPMMAIIATMMIGGMQDILLKKFSKPTSRVGLTDRWSVTCPVTRIVFMPASRSCHKCFEQRIEFRYRGQPSIKFRRRFTIRSLATCLPELRAPCPALRAL